MKTLLLVDDDPNDRLLVEIGCGRARVSFLLKTVESGVEAIRYLSGEGEVRNGAVQLDLRSTGIVYSAFISVEVH